MDIPGLGFSDRGALARVVVAMGVPIFYVFVCFGIYSILHDEFRWIP